MVCGYNSLDVFFFVYYTNTSIASLYRGNDYYLYTIFYADLSHDYDGDNIMYTIVRFRQNNNNTYNYIIIKNF